MSTIKEVVSKTSCDLCGVFCTPIREVKIYLGGSQDVSNYLVLQIHAYLPYATSDGDVCAECLGKHRQQLCEAIDEAIFAEAKR